MNEFVFVSSESSSLEATGAFVSGISRGPTAAKILANTDAFSLASYLLVD